jgi:hypothetical protein
LPDRSLPLGPEDDPGVVEPIGVESQKILVSRDDDSSLASSEVELLFVAR